MMESEELSDPSRFAKSGTEHGHQVALFAALAQFTTQCGELEWLHAIPNGGGRGDDKKSAMIQGGVMKAEGAKAGVLDLHWPLARHGFHGLMIEMKKPGIAKPSDKQEAYALYLNANGYCVRLCNHWAQAFRVIAWYGGFAERISEKAWALPDLGAAPFGYPIGEALKI